jgi:hypothetical protein
VDEDGVPWEVSWRTRVSTFLVHFFLLYAVGVLLGWFFVNHNAFEGTYDPSKFVATPPPAFYATFGLAFAALSLLFVAAAYHLAPLYLRSVVGWPRTWARRRDTREND